MDLRAALGANQTMTLQTGGRILVPTGIAIALPAGYEAQIRPRSGLAWRHGITCLNAPGTIDADYRGEIRVLLANLGQDSFTIKHGDRVAQLVIAPVSHIMWAIEDRLDNTARGPAGFGSTGRH